MRTCILLMFIWIGIDAVANQNELSTKVINVVDGNTLEIIGDDNQPQKIVLADIDSPELNQEYGDKARKFLEKQTLNKEVKVQLVGKDRKGNYLAIVLKDDVDIRVELLKEGLAWTAEKNPHPDLEAHRVKAQQKGKGLWKEENPTPPWIFRRQQSMMQAKSS